MGMVLRRLGLAPSSDQSGVIFISKEAKIKILDRYKFSDMYARQHRVKDNIRERRLKLLGHCVRHSKLAASPLILWEPTQGKATRGRRHTYVDLLMRDTGYATTEELRTRMLDRKVWREVVYLARDVVANTGLT
jgi:hypothetical protein